MCFGYVVQVRGEHFVKYFAALQTTDVAFWDYVFEHIVTRPGSPMTARNFLDDVERVFPESFRRCCACTATRNAASPKNPDSLPCHTLSHLWSRCFRRHASDRRIARFLVENLGMFGVFGDLLREPDFPASILESEPRLAWALNNADRWTPPPSLLRSIGQR